MNAAICTLYEGHYHHGVAALTNSFYRNGYRGVVYIGYKGDLPTWATASQDNLLLNWEGATTLKIVDGLVVHFLPLKVDYQLTNYKPDFMLELWQGPAKDAEAMFYFDPDIVVNCKWSFFESWVKYGVALIHEITSNDMSVNHPIRLLWRDIIYENKEEVNNSISSYINAGFFGLKKSQIQFIEKYSKFVHLSSQKYDVDLSLFEFTNRIDPFFAKDQDALNIAAMCTTSPLSEMGPEAMDFIPGGFTMSHAIGGPKPWKKNFILSALKGIPPSLAEKSFWNNVGLPIKTFENSTVKITKISIKISSFIGRFYRKY